MPGAGNRTLAYTSRECLENGSVVAAATGLRSEDRTPARRGRHGRSEIDSVPGPFVCHAACRSPSVRPTPEVETTTLREDTIKRMTDGLAAGRLAAIVNVPNPLTRSLYLPPGGADHAIHGASDCNAQPPLRRHPARSARVTVAGPSRMRPSPVAVRVPWPTPAPPCWYT